MALLVVLVGTCLITDLLARSRGLEKVLMARSSQFTEKNGTVFSNTGNFIDFEDRILLDEMPNVDYSRGGIYFFGSSTMKWAFTTWDLPAEQRGLIHNYGIGASNHAIQLRLIQYLIEHQGFLSAGEKDLIIIGVTFHLGHIDDPSSGFFASLLRRHDLYMTTPDQRILPVPMGAIEHWLRIEKARSGGFVWNVGRLAKSWLAPFAGSSSRPRPGLFDTPDRQRGFMGGTQWQQNIDAQLEQLKDTISLVRSHHAQIKVMLLPQGTWMDELPYKPYYETKLRALCKMTSTPLIDLSRVMPDEAFVDSSHLTVAAQKTYRDLVLKEISGHLQQLDKHAGS